jgi:hypothetical protein
MAKIFAASPQFPHILLIQKIKKEEMKIYSELSLSREKHGGNP